MIKITLDTNCIINLLDHTSTSATSVEEITEIIQYGLNSNVNIVITTRVNSDLEKDKDEHRKKELLKRINIFPTIGAPFRLDESKLDSEDFISDEKTSQQENRLIQIIFPNLKRTDKHYSNKINDIDHLIAHINDGRDIFVTDDGDIIRKSNVMEQEFNIKVMNPKKCLEYIQMKANKLLLINEFTEKFKIYKRFLVERKSNFTSSEILEFSNLREWFLKKHPIIKDGLIQFKYKLLSIDIGTQKIFEQSDILEIKILNDDIRKLFSKTTPGDVIKSLSYTEWDTRREVEIIINNIHDLLISYSGYVEVNF